MHRSMYQVRRNTSNRVSNWTGARRQDPLSRRRWIRGASYETLKLTIRPYAAGSCGTYVPVVPMVNERSHPRRIEAKVNAKNAKHLC